MIRKKLLNGLGQIVRGDWSGRTITHDGFESMVDTIASGDDDQLRMTLRRLQQINDDRHDSIEFLDELNPVEIEGAEQLTDQQQNDLYLLSSVVRARGLSSNWYDGRDLRDWLGEISQNQLRDVSKDILHRAHPRKDAETNEQPRSN